MSVSRNGFYTQPATFHWTMQTEVGAAQAYNPHIDNAEIARVYNVVRKEYHDRVFLQCTDEIGEFFIARIAIDYLEQLYFEDSIEVACKVVRIGNTSFDLGLALFQHGRCVSTCLTVMVGVVNGRPQTLSAAYRKALASELNA